MEKTNKYTLEQVRKVAEKVGKFVASVTRKPCDVGNLELSLDDGNLLNDDDVMRTIKELKRAEEIYDWRDKMMDYTPLKVISKIAGQLSLKLMGKKMTMKHNGKQKISVNPNVLRKKPVTIAWYLAHELTHVVDGQNYGDRRFEMIGRIADLSEQIVRKKHELGLVRGYLKPAKEVKEIQAEIDSSKKQLMNYMALIESHAEYVREQFVKSASLKPADYLSDREVLEAFMFLPLLLVPAIRKKVKQYSAGKKLIEMAYERKVDMGKVYDNVPTAEEFSNPEKYFQRVFPEATSTRWKVPLALKN